jgi:hypothetical protein
MQGDPLGADGVAERGEEEDKGNDPDRQRNKVDC